MKSEISSPYPNPDKEANVNEHHELLAQTNTINPGPSTLYPNRNQPPNFSPPLPPTTPIKPQQIVTVRKQPSNANKLSPDQQPSCSYAPPVSSNAPTLKALKPDPYRKIAKSKYKKSPPTVIKHPIIPKDHGQDDLNTEGPLYDAPPLEAPSTPRTRPPLAPKPVKPPHPPSVTPDKALVYEIPERQLGKHYSSSQQQDEAYSPSHLCSEEVSCVGQGSGQDDPHSEYHVILDPPQ